MRGHLKTAVVALAGVVLVVLFFRNANLSDVWAEVTRARIDLVVLAIVVTGLTYLFRAIRWQYLLAPIGHVGLGNALRTTVIGFAASAVLPARAGEVLRPWLLARKEGFSATAAFATIILERVLDKGIAVAVVGYTDALVATLFAQNGVPTHDAELDTTDIERQLEMYVTGRYAAAHRHPMP